MNMKRKSFFIMIIVIAVMVVSCTQLQQLATLAKCDFKLKSVDNIQLAGVNIQQKQNLSQINAMDVVKLTTAYMSKNLPLSFNLNVDSRNPNPTKAALTALDWILQIDDIDMTRGILNKRIEIAPNGGVTTIPMNMNFDLFKVLSGKSKDAVLNFAFNLTGAGNNTPTRITLKAKPTVMIGSVPIQYPGYISIKNTFVSK
jgi:LEA14-like dessication related protein